LGQAESDDVRCQVTVISHRRATRDALARVCQRRGFDAIVAEPRGSFPPGTKTILLDLCGLGPEAAEYVEQSHDVRVLGYGNPSGMTLTVPLDGWISDDASIADLCAALVDGPGSRARPAPRPPTPVADSLTPREQGVLHALLEGGDTMALAERLQISPHTVRTHVQNLLAKLGVTSRAEAVALALRTGLIPADRRAS
jgi:DNA-binding CsgD family transcriptional regulator